MGYVSTENSAEGSEVNIIIRNNSLAARVRKFPFLNV